MILNTFTIAGVDVKGPVNGLISLEVDCAINVVPNTLKATFATKKLQAQLVARIPTRTILSLCGSAVVVKFTNPLSQVWQSFTGIITHADPEGHLAYLEALGDSYILSKTTEAANGWVDAEGNAKITSVMHYIITNGTGLTNTPSAVSTNSVTGLQTNGQDRTTLLRYLCQMSYAAGVANPYVFYQSNVSGGSYIRTETFGKDSGIALRVGIEIVGRPKWTYYSEEVINDITVNYNGGSYHTSDAASIAAYGLRKSTYTNFCIDNATDAALIAATILWEWKSPKTQVVCDIDWKKLNNPTATSGCPVLNKTQAVTDALAGRTAVPMVCLRYKVRYPSGRVQLTLGDIPFMFTDLIRDIYSRLGNQETYNPSPNLVLASTTTLQNSHDAVVTDATATLHKVKTMTFTSGLPGTYHVKFDIICNAGTSSMGQVYRNGLPLTPGNSVAPGGWWTIGESFTLHLNAGDTLELWMSNTPGGGGNTTSVRNFRVYYDGLTYPATNS